MERVKYSREEIENTGEFASRYGTKPRKFNTPITARENMKLLYERKLPFWAPRFSELSMFGVDANPDNIARTKGGKDMFGIDWVYVPTVGGSIVRPGAPTVTDINRWEDFVTMPDPDTWDWAGSYERMKDAIDPDRMLHVVVLNGFFERLISFMDFAEAAVAMIDDDQKPGVHRLFETLCGIYEKIFLHIKKWFNVDIIQFHDDWGSQRAPFFSEATVREMVFPYIKRMVDVMHANGIYFDFHCCGKVESLVPVMIDAGMDSWSGQNMNDKCMLKRKYGDKLVIMAQPDPVKENASDEECLAAAQKFMEGTARDGGCLVGFPVPPKVDEYVYVLSRKAYCG